MTVRILSTLRTTAPGVTHHDFQAACRSLRSRVSSFVDRAEGFDAVVLTGSVSLRQRYDQLIAARLVSRRFPHKPVVLADCTWEAGSRAVSALLRAPRPVGVDAPGAHLRRITRLAIGRLRAPNLHCCVLSSHEKEQFGDSWGFDPDQVHFTPYWSSNLEALTTAAVNRNEPIVFAGGDSMRDYRTLLEAAPDIQATLMVATRLLMPRTTAPNVVAGPLPTQEYNAAAAAATVSVVPLIADAQRSGGQKTYLGAMALGQPVVVPQAPGVLDYIEPGRTGLVPPAGDAAALAESINALLADPGWADQLGRAARTTVRSQFTRERYASVLYGLAADLAA